MPAGQPSPLSHAMIQQVRDRIPVCLYIETACGSLGVTRFTWRNWLRRGAKEHRRLAKSPAAKAKESEALCLEFFNAVEKAINEGQFANCAVIHAAALGGRETYRDEQTFYDKDGVVTSKRTKVKRSEGQWQAAAWLNERRFPGLWGREEKIILKDATKEAKKLIAAQGLLDGNNEANGKAAAQANGKPATGTGKKRS